MNTELTPNRLRSLIDGYVDREDGTILHIKTNLLWQQKTLRKQLTWQKANQYLKRLKLGGYTDWRLPTIEELKFLVDRKYRVPIVHPVFQCYKEWYWSSTGYSWIIGASCGYSKRTFSFGFGMEGQSDIKEDRNYIRAVRNA